MSFEPEFLEFMPHTVTIYPKIDEDRYGNPVHDMSAGVVFRCRIGGKVVSLRRPEEEDVTNILDIWLGPRVDGFPAATTKITVLDKVVLPNDIEWFDNEPVIFAVGRYPDPDEIHHTKVQCGWMYHRQGQ